jgi:hypothetical protein
MKVYIGLLYVLVVLNIGLSLLALYVNGGR